MYPSFCNSNLITFVDVSIDVTSPCSDIQDHMTKGMKQDVTLACPQKWPEESTRASLSLSVLM